MKSLRKFVRSHASFVDHVPGKSTSPCFPWEEEEGSYAHLVMFIRKMRDGTGLEPSCPVEREEVRRPP